MLVSDIVIFVVSYGHYSDTVARHTHYHTVYSLVTGDLREEVYGHYDNTAIAV